ncbi:EamA-like transporter family protein [Microbulbifer aggregans]|uniref:EamA-like transporter family protein n=1 Tax=Microbulbifer aggregans TaxID=1769779 RepID=A0A1C9W471_9GAMM|nr:carboxylate/amino acid/amine transporter [Microbulbifer aggregans]AOS95930.1 EamA-like transporter family protein [Microbulbifer aggregans]
MSLLIFVTVLWAFSFSLIGVYLAGQVDSYFAVLTRILLAGLAFLPAFRWRGCDRRTALGLMAIGAVQLGLMYLFYYQSFLLLSVPEVLLFTIFTPVYIAVFYDLLERRFSPWNLLIAAVAVAGAAIIRWDQPAGSFWGGFLVVQGANICFAAGQVAYKQFMQRRPALQAHTAFAWFYLGAGIVAVAAWGLLGQPAYPGTPTQWAVLLWLGLVASGLGYYLWNQGATRVSAGTLAAMNNALIPAGLLVNLLIWNRDADLPRLALGGVVIVTSVLISEWRVRKGTQAAK